MLKEATLKYHITELKLRLVISIISFIIAFIICYYFCEEIYKFLLIPFANIIAENNGNYRLIYTNPAEAFTTYLRLSLWSAIFLTAPIFLNQFYLFLAPALYKNEKKYALSIIIGSPALFLLGSLMAYFFIAPLALKFFLSFEAVNFGASNLQLQLETRISEYLKLIINLIMGFGIAFQLPLILLLLLKFKIISVKFLAQKRRYWIVIIFIISAILTPPDVVSQVLLALPMILFFEIVILIAKRWDKSVG